MTEVVRQADDQRRRARTYARQGRYDEAIACWRRVEELDPYDADALGKIASLTLEKARHGAPAEQEAELDDANPVDAPLVDEAEAAERREELDDHRREPPKLVLNTRQQLEQAIRNNPEDETNYLELAELHLAENRVYDAQRTLARALDVCDDQQLLERLEDVNMLRARQRIESAEKRAAEEGTSKAHETVERLREESRQLQLDVYEARCARHPNDPRLQFQLGLRRKQSGQLKQSLDPLKSGLGVPEYMALASLEIGEILQRYRQFPKALQCYRQAAQLAAGDEGHAECRKRALYRAGVLATEMKLFDSARQYLQELAAAAPHYKDVRPRLDKLDEIGDDVRFDFDRR
jgi:tetratricopeptide (TPR) repeat protein